MKVIFEKQKLLSALIPALGSITTKSTIPAVEGINMVCDSSGKCTITSYDLEKGFQCTIEAEVESNGNYVINAQKLTQIVRTMPGDFITIEVDNNLIAKISCGKSEFELHALEGSDFPSLPNLEGENGFEISQNLFGKMITQTAFAIAQNNMRPELNGAYFKIENNKITAVSCDGNKLAICEEITEFKNNISVSEDIDISFLIPYRTLIEILKNIDETDDKMNINVSKKYVVFNVGTYTFFSRLIENEYIDYKRFIPTNSKIFVEVNREMLVDSLERAALVTEDKSLGQSKSVLKCSFIGNLLKISSISVTSKIYDEIYTEKLGEDLEIGFNCKFLLSALKSTDVERVKLSLTGPLMSMIIEPAVKEENSTFTFLVLPIKMKD